MRVIDSDRARTSFNVSAEVGKPRISGCALLERKTEVSCRIVKHGVPSLDLVGEGGEVRVDESEPRVPVAQPNGDAALVGHETHDAGSERVGGDGGDVLG